jgi:hypothetical protein
LADPLVFNTGIKVTFEHFGWISPDENPDRRSMSWNEREDDYASVAFWYQLGEPRFTERVPHSRERRLPSLERVVAYARDTDDGRNHGVGGVTRQTLDFYPGPQLLYMPKQAEGAWLEVPFDVERREPLRLLLTATVADDFGRHQAYLDGTKVGGTLEFYSATLGTKEFHLLDFWPETGRHTLRLQCVGRSVLSSGYYCGLESVRLRERRPRVAAMAHDKELDWRRDPRLYR